MENPHSPNSLHLRCLSCLPAHLMNIRREAMAAEPHVCDGIDLKWMYASDSEDEDDWYSNSPVVLTQELSLKGKIRRILFRNAGTRLGSTLFDIIAKLTLCVLYIIRIQFDHLELYACGGLPCGGNNTYQVYPDNDEDGMKFSSAEINWPVLLWVHRPEPIWIIEVILAIFTFSKALLFIFISKLRLNRSQLGKVELMTKPAFILEVICSLPLIVTLTYPMLLRDLFVPTFLNCWLAKRAMERLFNDLHLTKQRFQTISVTMSQQLLILGATLVSLIFTTVCGIQHIQRASQEKTLTLFESFYFTIVTFSTVGYGDISPDIWLGQLFMVLMICIAFAFIPRQIEGIGSIWVERKKSGGEYYSRQARKNHHVVVCAQNLAGDAIMDFLTEFYSCPKHEEYTVILLSSDELNSSMHMILKDPKWANRVIYMRGSALKAADLKRCRMNDADACFILAPENCTNKDREDHNTIMRSWAVKDFCPETNQFIQLFRTENKIHVKFAEHVVCEDEFAYALLANNCLYPGLSTLVSLLVHTSTGYEGEMASEPWMQLYGRHSGNEVYHIQLSKSIFFSKYEGQTFCHTSAEVHSKFGVSLIAVMETDLDKDKDKEMDHKLILNPGPSYILKGSDFCFYLSKFKEEHMKITPNRPVKEEKNEKKQQQREKNYEKIASELQRFLESNHLELDSSPAGEESVFNTITSQMGIDFSSSLIDPIQPIPETPDILQRGVGESVGNTTENHNVLLMYNEMASEESTPQFLSVDHAKPTVKSRFVTGCPPIFLTGCRKSLCHLVKNPRHPCCLRWAEDCSHVNYKNARDDRWQNHLIILSADKICVGVYNFIVPLRSKFLSIKSLSPIVIMLEEEPSSMYIDWLSNFPMVYWMKGNIKSVDDLLRAGINKASHLVIVNRSSNQAKEVVLTDADTIVTVQSIFKLFPSINILTEISQTSNIKFMQFQPHDEYSKKIARLEKKLREEMRSSLVHIFRLPFAAGQVFSCSMLDTLLYQTCSKGYLIKFVRLLLGIDAEENSGHLSSIKVKRDILIKYKTYGDLYIGLCKVTGEVPIAIYRTERRSAFVTHDEEEHHITKKEEKTSPTKAKKSSFNIKQFFERAVPNDLSDFVRSRMTSMSIDPSGYSCDDELRSKPLSFIIINPHPQCKLKKGDIVYVLQPSSMFAIPSRVQHKHNWRRRKSWSEGIHNRTEPEPPARSRTHSIDIPSRNVTFKSPDSNSEELSPMLDNSVEVKSDAEPLDSVDFALPKASTAKVQRGTAPIFNFTFPESPDTAIDDSSKQSRSATNLSNNNDSSKKSRSATNLSNNNDMELKDLSSEKPVNTPVEAVREPPKIVITRTPTKIFQTERVDE
ncbi:potassium channel subfamily T member 2-like isoform X3 [Saccostrea cucullata]|uniref:potassium channel subfamily T member 2-like isoform X3 n=1 Tax=Saccostrea cuccullata TaxID=36930 RepID=UPI002ED48DD0